MTFFKKKHLMWLLGIVIVLYVLFKILKGIFDICYYEVSELERGEMSAVLWDVDRYITNHINSLQLIANSDEFLEISKAQMDRKCNDILQLDYSGVRYVDLNGNIICQQEKETGFFRDEVIDNRTSQKYSNNNLSINGTLNKENPRKSVIVFTIPVYDKNLEIKAFVKAYMRAAKVEALLQQKNIRDGEQVFIINSSNDFYVLSADAWRSNYMFDRNAVFVDRQRPKKPDEYLYETLKEGRNTTYYSTTLTDTNWLMVKAVSKTAIYRAILQQMMHWLIVLVLVIILLLMTWVIIYQRRERKVEKERRHIEHLQLAEQISANMAHEIKNPLTSLKGFLQLVQKHYEKGREIKQSYFSIMYDEIDRIQSLSMQFCMISRPDERVEHTVLEMGCLLNEIYELMSVNAKERDIEIRLTIKDAELSVYGNRNQIKQIFINLISNAMDAMEGRPEQGIVEIVAWQEVKNICVAVRDNGKGMSKKLLDNIGQAFYTTKEKGTGLGLMITFDLVKKHGGTVKVKSEVGIGTEFTVILPYNSCGQV